MDMLITALVITTLSVFILIGYLKVQRKFRNLKYQIEYIYNQLRLLETKIVNTSKPSNKH